MFGQFRDWITKALQRAFGKQLETHKPIPQKLILPKGVKLKNLKRYLSKRGKTEQELHAARYPARKFHPDIDPRSEDHWSKSCHLAK